MGTSHGCKVPSQHTVSKFVFQEWHVGVPAGFVWLIRYIICDAIFHVFMV